MSGNDFSNKNTQSVSSDNPIDEKINDNQTSTTEEKNVSKNEMKKNSSSVGCQKSCCSENCSENHSENEEHEEALNTAGGQAVLEGIMMRTKKNYALAVRKESGEIVVRTGVVKSIRDKFKFFNLPFIRGSVNMIESLMSSFKNLEESMEMAGIEFEEEPTKFEKWLEKKFGKSIINVITAIASVLGVLLAVLLFFYLPSLLADGVEFLVEKVAFADRSTGSLPSWGYNIIEGVFKIIIFVLYIAITSKLDDIDRVYQYHGAEHKTIFCYENNEELTIENVKKYKRFHPRCGTSFIFVILIISIAVMTCATSIMNAFSLSIASNNFIRMILKLLLLPLTIGIGYEFIRYAGAHDNVFTRILSAPGLWMQRLTTKEPDESMIEVAIVSLKSALPKQYPVIEELERQKEKFAKEAEKTESEDASSDSENSEDSEDSTQTEDSSQPHESDNQ